MTKEIKWTIDPVHSEIAFKVKHLMITNVKGVFTKFDASVYTTGRDFTTADIDVWIDASSIDTNDKKRDEHLMSADFFDVENHKQITFVASGIQRSSKNGGVVLKGNLTMRGVTNKINLNVEFGGVMKDPWGNEKAGFTLIGKINRKEWGLNWNTALEAGGLMVSEEVIIACEVQLVKATLTEAAMEMAEENFAVSA